MRFYILGSLNEDYLRCYDRANERSLSNVRISSSQRNQAERLIDKINKDLNKI